MALGSSQPLTEMRTRNISWGKGGWCYLHVPIVLKSRSLSLLETSGPVKVCNVIALALAFFNYVITILCGPGSSVGIVTDYGLDGPGIVSPVGRDFSHTSRPALGPTQPPL
jgi:hypothetical protein